MKKILSRLLAAALPLSAACTMVARAEENPAPSGLVPGLVEMTVFGNHVDKPESVYPQANGQIFNEGYTPENAPVYCNPIVFNYNYSANAGETLGVVSDAPFSAAFIANIIESSPTERYTHLTNAVLFRGTATYLKENNSRSAADPHAIYYNNVWYVYASGGYQLRSEDFVNWEVVPAMNADGTQMTFTAPSVGYRTDESGKTTFYLAWNSSHIYSSETPTGPWTDLGDFTYRGMSFSDNALYNKEDNTYGPSHAADAADDAESVIIAAHNDVDLFVDHDTNRMYLCWGMGSKELSIAELNPDNPSELLSAPVPVITHNPTVTWENFGQHHEDYATGFAEGSMMFKYNGVYYWTFATGGTQYDSYTFGVYTNKTDDLLNADNWVYQNQEVINPDGDDAMWGAVRGGGHGSIAEGPNGQLWCFYTVNVGYEGDMERRLGADPAYVTEDGVLVVPHLSENPQYAPGVLANPCGEAGNETGSDILSARQGYAVSSYHEGRHPMYASDESPLTWWQPADDDAQPWYLVSLKGYYNVDSIRVMLKDVELNHANTYGTNHSEYSYKIEVYNGIENPVTAPISESNSEEGWVTVWEGTSNILNFIDMEEPVEAMFVRITFTDWTGKVS